MTDLTVNEFHPGFFRNLAVIEYRIIYDTKGMFTFFAQESLSSILIGSVLLEVDRTADWTAHDFMIICVNIF